MAVPGRVIQRDQRALMSASLQPCHQPRHDAFRAAAVKGVDDRGDLHSTRREACRWGGNGCVDCSRLVANDARESVMNCGAVSVEAVCAGDYRGFHPKPICFFQNIASVTAHCEMR